MYDFFKLPLNDPLWRKLDYAKATKVPERLRLSGDKWDSQKASMLYWDSFSDQDTCYRGTYAAIPYLIDIADQTPDLTVRGKIAYLLGRVMILPNDKSQWCSSKDNSFFHALPTSLARLGNKANVVGEGNADTLKADPVSEAERIKIESIKHSFSQSGAAIADICRRAFYEAEDINLKFGLLGGVAACNDFHNLARLLYNGDEGHITCRHCEQSLRYLQFDVEMALYDRTEQDVIAIHPSEGVPHLLDWDEGAPSRQDAIVIPFEANSASTQAERLLCCIAENETDDKARTLLLNLLGSFTCPKCGDTDHISARTENQIIGES